ncbi:hypothetical protein CRG98_036736 [Punica granatum]|uniref:Uncharacterized protein n=1 Tax=Punica granatum TaxID=22663 RepID=A0A2I0IG40_PUNGR|nr:hypothetical protein CRG98_036736 [Punica granatum]
MPQKLLSNCRMILFGDAAEGRKSEREREAPAVEERGWSRALIHRRSRDLIYGCSDGDMGLTPSTNKSSPISILLWRLGSEPPSPMISRLSLCDWGDHGQSRLQSLPLLLYTRSLEAAAIAAPCL